MKHIKFYKTRSGKSPIVDFLDSLDSKQSKKIIWVFRIIEKMHKVPKEYFKKLSGTSGIWEIRVQSGSNSIRLLGFMDNAKFIVLTNGFHKKSQKTPIKEITVAEKRKTDYLNRKGES